MKQLHLLFAIALLSFTAKAQQINGVFTDFAVNNEWANTAINTATQETNGYITLGGYYHGRTPENMIPLMLQINSSGVIRTELGGAGALLIPSVSGTYGNTEVQRTFLANNSSTANSQQFIISGRKVVPENYASDGFLLKMFGNGTRPTAFNGGNTFTYSGGAASAQGYIQDWVTGTNVYTVRLNGPQFAQARILLSAFNKETAAAVASFATNGTLTLNAAEGDYLDYARPVRLIIPPGGTHANKFYVAFSAMPLLGPGASVNICRINSATGIIDSSFGSNGYKSFPTSSRYHITSLLANNDESITIGGYGDEGLQSVPSFFTFRPDESIVITSFNYLLGEPNPGYGSKNIGAKKATINGQERIVFAYAHPVNTNEQYKIAIASLSPTNGAGSDPLLHQPWLGAGFTSAEPTSIITLSGNAGFIVTGKATRNNGSLAGIVLKYRNDGTLDGSFANNGVLIVNARGGGPQWANASQLSTNKYLAVGTAEFVSGEVSKKAVILSRFNSNGSIDSSFGTNGTLYSMKSDYARNGQKIFPLPNGEFLMTGSYVSTNNEPGTIGIGGSEAILCKYNADGSPHATFGPFNNGRFHYFSSTLNDVRIMGEHIFAVANPNGTVLKLSAAGNLVNSYGSGLALLQGYDINESTGYIYAGGRRNSVTAKQVTKMTPGGNVDLSFGTNGYTAIPIISSGDNANVSELKLKPLGGLFAVMSWSSASAQYGIFFSSISEAGVLDLNFGTNGAKFLQLPNATNTSAAAYRWTGANNDTLFIFGLATVNSVQQGFVCKVDLNGDLVTDFGNHGVIWTTETFVGTVGFDNGGNALAIKNYNFFGGVALAKVSVPADVYNHIKTGSWTGSIDNDWFKPGNWAEGFVPDQYTSVNIANGNVAIGGNRTAFAWSVDVANGANLTVQSSSTLELTEHNP